MRTIKEPGTHKTAARIMGSCEGQRGTLWAWEHEESRPESPGEVDTLLTYSGGWSYLEVLP